MSFVDLVIELFTKADHFLVTIATEYGMFVYAAMIMIFFLETGIVIMAFLPGDSLLFVSGAVASLPGMPLEISLLMMVIFIAAVLGDSCNYLIGHYFGKKLFSKPDSKIFKQSHLEKTHHFFQKYGGKAIIIARFVPIVRTFAPFVAGMGHMNYYLFMIYNLVGAAVWVLLFCMTGYFFGNIPFVQQNLKILLIGIVLVSLCPALIEYIRIKNKRTTV